MALESSATLRKAQCNLIDIFSGDPRPTIIIDVSATKYAREVPWEFANAAFTDQYAVLVRFIKVPSGQIPEPDFIVWLRSPQPTSNEYLVGGLSWTFFMIEGRFKVVNVAASRPNVDRSAAGVPQQITPIMECPSSSPGWSLTTRRSSTVSPVSGKSANPFTVALQSGLMRLGSAPTALDGLHRLVDMLNIGFFEYDLEGVLMFANKSWYEMSGPTSPQAHTEMQFLDLCHTDDIDVVTDAWGQLINGKPITFEMRWKHIGFPTAEALGAQWVLAACLPMYDENDKLSSITGCTMDINCQKLNEQIARARAVALEQARTSEERFTRFATVAPIAVFSFDANKRMTYCNNHWFELTTTTKKPFEEVGIGEGFFEEDVSKLYTLVDKAIQDREVNSVEMRTKRFWRASDGRKAQFWVLASIFAEFTNEGKFQGCTGTLTDISEIKYAETHQRIRLEEALEAKRQQENFIDMTSHEMRNPLSAMVQCADSALAALAEINNLLQPITTEQLPAATRNALLDEVGLGSEGLQTIISCCAHQKCMIDDVLTLSKLDLDLLAITPAKVEPTSVMKVVAKMFEMDAQKAGMEFTTQVEASLENLNIEWLMMDPSRVKQILINLISNAIKFTRTEATRKVVLAMHASLEVPSSFSGGVGYTPASRSVADNFLAEKDWGSGEVVYLQFSVQDTGKGVCHEDQERVFHRFSSASPKTHVEYGTAGLGLFVSRQLTELQGGEIGVTSEAGKGSTFAFYIQTRRTSPPETLPSRTSGPALMPLQPPPKKLLSPDPRVEDNVNLDQRLGDISVSSPSKTNQADWQPRVLIVEDNTVNQKVLSKQLKRLGCTVFVAGHGREALDFLKTTQLWHENAEEGTGRTNEASSTGQLSETPLDVILMDIEMPVMDGLACTKAIRELEGQGSIRPAQLQQPHRHKQKHHRLPIISISANARVEQSNEQREAGVDDIVTKPFRIPQLMDKIWRLIGRETPYDTHG